MTSDEPRLIDSWWHAANDLAIGRIFPALVALALALAMVTPAHARNASNARGIESVAQASREERGTLEERDRLFRNAVVEFRQGLGEDPTDSEAWLYLARAYGELDSMAEAGAAFAEVLRRAQEDPKLLKRASEGRNYYFLAHYNLGLKLIRDAAVIMPVDSIRKAADPRASAARGKLARAAAEFRDALAVNPEKAIGYDALAQALELQGNPDRADVVIERGLANSIPKKGDEYQRLVKRHRDR